MNYRQHGPGGFGFDPDQIFGPNGILNQVFGQGGTPPWGQQRPPRPPRPPHGARRARRGDVRNAVLHLLQRESMNGYQLMQEIAQSSGGAWQPSSGAIYPALAQLEDEGLIEPVEVDGRKAYQLTDAGRMAAEELPHQTWSVAGGAEPEDPWAEDAERRAGGRRRGRGGPGGFGGPGWQDQGRGRFQRGAQLWKALGSVAMATQAVGQAGDEQLSREATELLDATRRDLYRLLAEAEVARDEQDDHEAGDTDDTEDVEFAEGEIVDED